MIRAQRINRDQHHVQGGLRGFLHPCRIRNQYREHKKQSQQSSVTSVPSVVQAFPRLLNESFPSVYPNAALPTVTQAQPLWYAER
jgi:hypothetical protein